MREILYLTRREVATLLPDLPDQVDLVERTYRAMAAGRVEQPPKPGVHPRRDAFLHAMPAYLRDDDVAALKWVAGYPGNPARGLPTISGLVVVNDADTGLPQAVMDAAEITAARTAAASALCVDRFAPPGWRSVAILGCGEQGQYHARALRSLNPQVSIRAYDPVGERAPAVGEAAPDPRSAVAGAEVVVSAGPIVERPRPALAPDWLGERWLALPLDFDFAFQGATIARADLFLVDDVDQFEYYRRQGHFSGWPHPHGSVGEALGHRAEVERVACVNLGVGALDAAFAARVVAEARSRGVGTLLPA